jgi:hypothetical protein
MTHSKLLMGGKQDNGSCDSTIQKGHLGRYSDRKRLEDKGAISDVVVGTVKLINLVSGKKILTLVIFISCFISYAAEILAGRQHCDARRVAPSCGVRSSMRRQRNSRYLASALFCG